MICLDKGRIKMINELIMDKLFSFSTEELRQELCMSGYKLFKLRKLQIKDKFRDIIEMLDKQEVYHETWNKSFGIKKNKQS